MDTWYILGIILWPELYPNLRNNMPDYNGILLWLSNAVYKFYIGRNQSIDKLYYFPHIGEI